MSRKVTTSTVEATKTVRRKSHLLVTRNPQHAEEIAFIPKKAAITNPVYAGPATGQVTSVWKSPKKKAKVIPLVIMKGIIKVTLASVNASRLVSVIRASFSSPSCNIVGIAKKTDAPMRQHRVNSKNRRSFAQVIVPKADKMIEAKMLPNMPENWYMEKNRLL